jgi:hypothetical protein
MVTNARRKTRKKAAGASLSLAAASEAVGNAVGRAVGGVERMMKLARKRVSSMGAARQRRPAAKKTAPRGSRRRTGATD